MLKPGDRVPDFTLPLAYADGRRDDVVSARPDAALTTSRTRRGRRSGSGAFDDVAFASLLGRGPVVISFFPLAFTRVCTTQMCEARDNAAQYEALGATLVGFSCDSKWANWHFAAEEKLAHGIFSDANRSVVDRLWETQTTAGVERVPKRGFMVIDARGVVVDVHVTDVSGAPWVGMDPILAAIKKALS